MKWEYIVIGIVIVLAIWLHAFWYHPIECKMSGGIWIPCEESGSGCYCTCPDHDGVWVMSEKKCYEYGTGHSYYE